MKLAIGQRWIYKDTDYIWVVEVIGLNPKRGCVVQIIRDYWVENGKTSGYECGHKVNLHTIEDADQKYYTYLPGQDKP